MSCDSPKVIKYIATLSQLHHITTIQQLFAKHLPLNSSCPGTLYFGLMLLGQTGDMLRNHLQECDDGNVSEVIKLVQI